MVLLLFALFVVVPLAELYVIIQVGQAIGALPTIALLLLDSLLGAWLARSQGRAVWRRFQAALAAGRPPAREVLDGALVIAGGALLLAPASSPTSSARFCWRRPRARSHAARSCAAPAAGC